MTPSEVWHKGSRKVLKVVFINKEGATPGTTYYLLIYIIW